MQLAFSKFNFWIVFSDSNYCIIRRNENCLDIKGVMALLKKRRENYVKLLIGFMLV